jgi:asparagine synthase (glutamine-hydrolysing)
VLRYIAIAWNAHDAQQTHRAQRHIASINASLASWHTALSVEGLSLLCSTPVAMRLAGNRGVVLGKLFHATEEDVAPEVTAFDETASAEILRTEGRSLITRYWGRYVAFLYDEATHTVRLIRDPTGGVACSLITAHELTIAFSRLEDCACLDLPQFSINWDYVSAYVARPCPQVRATGLNEVFQLLPGECLTLARGRKPTRAFYWDPMRISESDPLENLSAAAAAARRTVHRCVRAWAASRTHIVHRLSGGLDSAIVLACLRGAPSPPRITCINDYDNTASGDERQFARLSFQGSGRPRPQDGALVEYEWNPARTRLDAVLDAARLPSPLDYKANLFAWHSATLIGRELQADLFDGSFGDPVFYRPRQYSTIDYVWRHGMGRHLLSIAHATAHGGRHSLWAVLRKGLREGRQRRKRRIALPDRSPFVDAGVFESAVAQAKRYLSPPWLTDDMRVPPGKFDHIGQMYVPSADLNPFARPGDPPRVMPLASQPLIELFLRIPTYVLTAGGRDRAVARHAFSAELPQQIAWRRSKGITNELELMIFQHHAPFVRELFLDGVLVKERLLERRKVEQFIDSVCDYDAPGFTTLFSTYFDLEVWLRSWRGVARESRAAA